MIRLVRAISLNVSFLEPCFKPKEKKAHACNDLVLEDREMAMVLSCMLCFVMFVRT